MHNHQFNIICLNILVVVQALSSGSINNEEELVNCDEDDFIDIDSLLNDDTLMSISP